MPDSCPHTFPLGPPPLPHSPPHLYRTRAAPPHTAVATPLTTVPAHHRSPVAATLQFTCPTTPLPGFNTCVVRYTVYCLHLRTLLILGQRRMRCLTPLLYLLPDGHAYRWADGEPPPRPDSTAPFAIPGTLRGCYPTRHARSFCALPGYHTRRLFPPPPPCRFHHTHTPLPHPPPHLPTPPPTPPHTAPPPHAPPHHTTLPPSWHIQWPHLVPAHLAHCSGLRCATLRRNARSTRGLPRRAQYRTCRLLPALRCASPYSYQ